MQTADDGNSSAGSGDKEANIGPFIQFAFRPMQEIDESLTRTWLVTSLIGAARLMADDLSERADVAPWMQRELQHLKNVLTIAEERLIEARKAGEDAGARLLTGLAALKRAA